MKCRERRESALPAIRRSHLSEMRGDLAADRAVVPAPSVKGEQQASGRRQPEPPPGAGARYFAAGGTDPSTGPLLSAL